MVVVDSSGWIEFFANGPKAEAYGRYLKNPDNIFTPPIVVYEVYKKVKRERGEETAKLCLAQIEKTHIVPLDHALAVRAADLSLEFSFAMADAFVLATAYSVGAELITSDSDFRKIPGVKVL
jgi:toxin FitB